jgi:hypothetical protein
LTQKRGVVDFDWTFFTVMQLVACQLTMERKYHWLLYIGGSLKLKAARSPRKYFKILFQKSDISTLFLKYGGVHLNQQQRQRQRWLLADVAAAAAVVAAEKAVEAAIATPKSAGAARATPNSAWAAREKAAAVAAAVDVVRAVAAAAVHSCSGSGCSHKT